jgi:hypothetical protein
MPLSRLFSILFEPLRIFEIPLYTIVTLVVNETSQYSCDIIYIHTLS